MADYYRLKSLDEMLESIDIGMDVEFYLYNVRYNISWRNNKPFSEYVIQFSQYFNIPV